MEERTNLARLTPNFIKKLSFLGIQNDIEASWDEIKVSIFESALKHRNTKILPHSFSNKNATNEMNVVSNGLHSRWGELGNKTFWKTLEGEELLEKERAKPKKVFNFKIDS